MYEGEEDQQLREEEWQQRYLTKEPVNLTQTVSSGVLIDIILIDLLVEVPVLVRVVLEGGVEAVSDWPGGF